MKKEITCSHTRGAKRAGINQLRWRKKRVTIEKDGKKIRDLVNLEKFKAYFESFHVFKKNDFIWFDI